MKKRMMLGMMFVLFAFTCVLAGCNTKSDKEIMQEAVKKAQESDSVAAQAKFNIDITVAAGGKSQRINMDMDMKSDSIEKGNKSRTVVDAEVMGQSVHNENYKVKKDGKVITYTKKEDNWTREENEDTKEEKSTNEIKASSFLDDKANFKSNGEAEENGKKYLVFEGIMTEEMIKNSSKTFQSAQAQLGGSSDINMDGMGDIPITIWIEKDTGTLYRAKFSMASYMKKMMSSLMAAASSDTKVDVQVSKCDMDIRFVSYNNVEKFDVPQEAIQATETGVESNQYDSDTTIDDDESTDTTDTAESPEPTDSIDSEDTDTDSDTDTTDMDSSETDSSDTDLGE